jgi:carboxypeptidase family protein
MALTRLIAAVLVALALMPGIALAQITTGAVTGIVRDPSGAVIPGATVVLTSETRGTKAAPVATNESGNYVFPPRCPARSFAMDFAPRRCSRVCWTACTRMPSRTAGQRRTTPPAAVAIVPISVAARTSYVS